MRHRPVAGPLGLFNVSKMPRFLADSNAVGWEGAFFTDIWAAEDGTVEQGHSQFCLQHWATPFKTRELRAGAAWNALHAGASVWCPGDEQRFEWQGGGGRQFLFIDACRVEQVLEQPAVLQNFRARPGEVRVSPVVNLIMQALACDLHDGSPAGPLVGDGLITALLAHLQGTTPARPAQGLAPSTLKRVLACIEDRLSDDLTLAELADLARMSVRHFCRAFRASNGCAPHQYLLRQRVERAKGLMEAGKMPLADIALHLGFADQSQFTRTFKRHTGSTPAAHRSAR